MSRNAQQALTGPLHSFDPLDVLNEKKIVHVISGLHRGGAQPYVALPPCHLGVTE